MNRIVALVVVLAASSALAGGEVLMVINEGFHPAEYEVPRAVLEKAGYKVTVAARYEGLVRPGRRRGGQPVQPELTLEKVQVSRYDAIAFVGGGGAWSDYFPNLEAHRIVREAMAQGRVLGLICAATGLLAVTDNLSGQGQPVAVGRHVTGYREVEGLLRTLGRVRYDAGDKDKPHVVTDGTLITARDPGSAEAFGQALVGKLRALGEAASK